MLPRSMRGRVGRSRVRAPAPRLVTAQLGVPGRARCAERLPLAGLEVGKTQRGGGSHEGGRDIAPTPRGIRESQESRDLVQYLAGSLEQVLEADLSVALVVQVLACTVPRDSSKRVC